MTEGAPSPAERDALFKAFGRAFFRQDVDAMYAVVTEDFTWTVPVGEGVRVLDSPAAVAAFFAERRGTLEHVRFEDVVLHHAAEATFMTYRMTAVEVATGESVARVGVERYTFRDGRIAIKDVYTRPAGAGGAEDR